MQLPKKGHTALKSIESRKYDSLSIYLHHYLNDSFFCLVYSYGLGGYPLYRFIISCFMILAVEVYVVDLEAMKREIETLVVAKGLSEETVARARLRIRLPKR